MGVLATACAGHQAGAPAAGPSAEILVNQVGYLPGFPKIATVRGVGDAAVAWQLLDAAGKPVASGQTQPFGPDASSGDDVQLVDFTSFDAPGRGYRLAVAGGKSHPFAVAPDVYGKLKYDALALFYHQRSGTPIVMPYAGDPKWVRKAGHESDRKVPCAPGIGCKYSLDVSGGWYDAGDQGKYVVNGGISVWTMLDQWERARHLGKSAAAFGDGKMNIPENHNGVPDLLDEVRWELEFLLRMQVPAGEKLAGMVHHKIHDDAWTGLGLAPADDPRPRFLQPVSTAATLNLAAVAAQGARVWKELDPAFSKRCLEAAQRAWVAAKANPSLLAEPGGQGGGAYEDRKVEDEFYWAAAELFITTGGAEYGKYLRASPLFGKVPTDVEAGHPTSMTWAEVASCGSISLAVVPNALTPAERVAVRAAVKGAADQYVAAEAAEGYRTPFRANGYPWGSNSFVLNNLLVIALADDLTHDPKYGQAVAVGMDYLLGRNALDQSYVSGYGARPLQHPHHRFFASQLNPAFPPPPPGVVSGGPNSALQDPKVRALGLAGCAPQQCWADEIEAYSVNELAINWNAPLAWVAAWLDEAAQRQGKP
jgi:endoglucanase